MYFGIMVLIWAPLSQESHTTLPIYPHSSHVFDPVPLFKGVQIQEGSLLGGLYIKSLCLGAL